MNKQFLIWVGLGTLAGVILAAWLWFPMDLFSDTASSLVWRFCAAATVLVGGILGGIAGTGE